MTKNNSEFATPVDPWKLVHVDSVLSATGLSEDWFFANMDADTFYAVRVSEDEWAMPAFEIDRLRAVVIKTFESARRGLY